MVRLEKRSKNDLSRPINGYEITRNCLLPSPPPPPPSPTLYCRCHAIEITPLPPNKALLPAAFQNGRDAVTSSSIVSGTSLIPNLTSQWEHFLPINNHSLVVIYIRHLDRAYNAPSLSLMINERIFPFRENASVKKRVYKSVEHISASINKCFIIKFHSNLFVRIELDRWYVFNLRGNRLHVRGYLQHF